MLVSLKPVKKECSIEVSDFNSGSFRLTWGEVDWEQRIWTIPPERMKAKFMYRVPLSRTAIEILKKQKAFDSDLVFPSIRAKKIVTDMTMPLAIHRAARPLPTAFVPAFAIGVAKPITLAIWPNALWRIRCRTKSKRHTTAPICSINAVP
jgi:hypothetical protein